MDLNDFKYKLPTDRIPQQDWWRNRFDLIHKYVQETTKKNFHPLVSFYRDHQTLQGIVVDLDPKTMKESMLAEELWENAIHMGAIPFNSVTGTPKALFLVELSDKVPFHKWEHLAADILKSLLPEDYHWFDPKGASRCFVNQFTADQLKFWIPKAPIHKIDLTDYNVDLSMGYEYTLYSYNGQLPNFTKEFIGIGKGANIRESLIRILLATHNLSFGFNLPTKLLAAQIGTTPTTVSRLLKELQDRRWLLCTDATYIQGKKAKTYQARGKLLNFVNKKRMCAQDGESLPKEAYEGNAYQPALAALSKCHTKESYMQWAEEVWVGSKFGRERFLRDCARYYASKERRAA